MTKCIDQLFGSIKIHLLSAVRDHSKLENNNDKEESQAEDYCSDDCDADEMPNKLLNFVLYNNIIIFILYQSELNNIIAN